MKKTLIILAAALVALPALALPNGGLLKDTGLLPEGSRSRLRGIVQTAVRHLLNFREETPLSADQRSQVGAILKQHGTEIRELMKRGRDARRSFEEIARKGSPDSAVTREAAGKLADVTRDRALLMAKVGGQVRPLLTPDQQKRLETARTEIHDLIDAALAEKNL